MEAVEHHLQEAGEKVALRFIDAVEKAFAHIAHHPASGSPPYGLELELPGIRSWPIERFEHLVCYIECDDHVDVWRVLHARRDIPVSLRDRSGG